MKIESLNLEEVTFIITDFLEKEFEIKELPIIKMNSRLGRGTLARFMWNGLDRKTSIKTIDVATKSEYWEIAADLYKCDTALQCNISAVLHECVHYALYVKDADFRDGDVSFELELKKRSIISNYNKERLEKRWKRKGDNWLDAFNEYCSISTKRFDKDYERIILAKRKKRLKQVI